MAVKIDAGLLKELKGDTGKQELALLKKPLPNEKGLYKSEDNDLILTTHRVRYENNGKTTSIMLEELCSCEIHYTSRPKRLAYAAISVIGGFAGDSTLNLGFTYLGLIVGLFFVIAYFLSRKEILTLDSGGAMINIPVGGKGKWMDFVDKVESAKNQRSLFLKGIEQKA